MNEDNTKIGAIIILEDELKVNIQNILKDNYQYLDKLINIFLGKYKGDIYIENYNKRKISFDIRSKEKLLAKIKLINCSDLHKPIWAVTKDNWTIHYLLGNPIDNNLRVETIKEIYQDKKFILEKFITSYAYLFRLSNGNKYLNIYIEKRRKENIIKDEKGLFEKLIQISFQENIKDIYAIIYNHFDRVENCPRVDIKKYYDYNGFEKITDYICIEYGELKGFQSSEKTDKKTIQELEYNQIISINRIVREKKR